MSLPRLDNAAAAPACTLDWRAPDSARDLTRRLWLIFGFVTLDVVGYSLVIPLIPYYASALGASVTAAGLITAVGYLAQFFAAPVLGQLSDRYGRRPLLLVSVLGIIASFSLFAWARALWVLFAARALYGLLGGNTPLARAYVSDISGLRDRARCLGIPAAALGLGLVAGPLLGGMLARWGTTVPAVFAAVLMCINLVGVWWLLPESLTPEARAQARLQPRRNGPSARELWAALQRPCCALVLQTYLVYTLAAALFLENLSLYGESYLELSAGGTGLLVAYQGLMVVLVQGLGVGRLTARYRERVLIGVAALILTLAMFAWSASAAGLFAALRAPILLPWLLVLAPIVAADGLLDTLLSSQLTQLVPPDEAGSVLGLATSLQTIARIVAPATGALLLQRLGVRTPGLLGGVVMLWACVLAWRLWRAPTPVYME